MAYGLALSRMMLASMTMMVVASMLASSVKAKRDFPLCEIWLWRSTAR
jgi:hypothetical protein